MGFANVRAGTAAQGGDGAELRPARRERPVLRPVLLVYRSSTPQPAMVRHSMTRYGAHRAAGFHDCVWCNGSATVLARLSETFLLLGRPEQARPAPKCRACMLVRAPRTLGAKDAQCGTPPRASQMVRSELKTPVSSSNHLTCVMDG